MKKDIHPQYYSDAKIICACGNSFNVGSTVKEIHIEICSICHPFYTGKQKLIDTARRVEKFQARLSKKQSAGEMKSKKAKLAIRAKKKSARGATAKAGQGPAADKKKEAAKTKTGK